MKCKLRNLVKAKASFDKIIKQDIDITVAFDFQKKWRPILVEFKTYEDGQKKLFEKLGKNDGMKMTIDPDKMPEFNKEIEKLLAHEVDVSFEKLSVKVLKEQALKLSVKDLMDLEEFLTK